MRYVVYVFNSLRGDYVVYCTTESADEATEKAVEALRSGEKSIVIEVVEQ